MKQELENIRSEYQSLDSSLSQVRAELIDLIEERQWIQNIDYDTEYPDSLSEPFLVKTWWNFNDIEIDSIVHMKIREIGTTEWEIYEAIFLEGGRYEAVVEVIPTKQYEYQIIAEGTTRKSSEIYHLPDELYTHQLLFMESSSYSHTTNDTLNYFEATFSQPSHQPEFLEVREAKAFITYEDGESEEVILTKQRHTNYNQWTLQIDRKGITEIELEVMYRSGHREQRTIHPYDEYSGELHGY